MIDVKRFGAILALLGGVLVSVTGTAQADAPLNWGPCPDYGIPGPCNPTAGLDCATLRVPLDYTRPRGRTTELTISRHTGPDSAKRRGVLLVSPNACGNAAVVALPRVGVVHQGTLMKQRRRPGSRVATGPFAGCDQ